MGLPQLNNPTYELNLPSTKQKISYRPFLVKEQKILMMAQETNKSSDLIKATSDIVKTCTFGAIRKPEDLPTYDMEYLFLKIRGKSVGDKVTLNLLCPDDEKTRVMTEIDLNDVKLKGEPKKEEVIQLTDDIGITLTYPKVKDLMGIDTDASAVKLTFDVIASTTKNIYDKDNVYEDFTKEELSDFIDSLNSEQFEKIQQFYEGTPKLSHKVKVKNPKTEVESEIEIEGLQSFLE